MCSINPCSGTYPEETFIQKDTCTPVFSAALFTIAKMQKQSKCPLTDEWIKKMQYLYTMGYYSARYFLMLTHQVSPCFEISKPNLLHIFFCHASVSIIISPTLCTFLNQENGNHQAHSIFSILYYLSLFLLSCSGIDVTTFFPKLIHMCFLEDLIQQFI